MLPESRRVARLLLTHPTKEQWFEALKVDNILQKKSPATARRQARLIRNRLDTLEDEAWSLIAEGSQEVATQLLFAAAIKHSRVLADFLRDVYAGHLRRLEQNISPAKDW
ncbi:BrxA family protein, partial [Dokdonella sp.]|uniref:BrxA family protein n=1 Tax=Dokdonella sp. TaxID=2291710 RepID=UPI002DD667C2